MIDGPLSAPSSPPDTPVPTKCRPCSFSSFSRRMVSGKWALPASMMMSPSSSRATSSAITASVPGPALTMMITRRGRSSEATKSAIDSDGDEVALVSGLGDQRLGLGVGAVVDRHPVPVPGEVPGEVAAHHRQSGDADLRQLLMIENSFVDVRRSSSGRTPRRWPQRRGSSARRLPVGELGHWRTGDAATAGHQRRGGGDLRPAGPT